MALQLAHWINSFDYDGVPDHILERTKVSLLDAIGGAFAASSYSHAAKDALMVIDGMGGTGPCTIIGESRRTSVVDAVFANGLLIRALDFNDYLPRDPNDGARLGSHPSDNMAVGLAVGERHATSGRDFLTAMVMGYELNGRLLRAFQPNSYWDNTTATGLTSPAIAGRLMGLGSDRLASAIAFSLAHSTTHKSVRRGSISAAKFLADPFVARTGVFATLLAAGGIVGPTSVLDGPSSIGKAVFPLEDLSGLVRPLDEFYIFEGVCIKAYPCFANSQAAISAALEIRKSFTGPLDEISRIQLRLADLPSVTSQLSDVGRRHPTNRESADHSFHYVVAIALMDGEVTLKSFESDRWHNSAVKKLMAKIEIVPDPSWNRREHSGAPASIKAETLDGRIFSAEVAFQRGHVKNPMEIGEIVAKFVSNVEGVIDPRQAEEIVDIVRHLETLDTLKPLLDQLGATSSAVASDPKRAP
jgi:2-methylcitrate dehydratase